MAPESPGIRKETFDGANPIGKHFGAVEGLELGLRMAGGLRIDVYDVEIAGIELEGRHAGSDRGSKD